MKIRVAIFALIITTISAFPALAHHAATATFDTSQSVEIEGYVTKFAFNNPHVAIFLMVEDAEGNQQEWMATAPAVAPFRNWGWDDETVLEGQYVKLVGRKARRDAPMILMEREDIEGGNLYELNPSDGSVMRVLGQEAIASNDSSAAPTTIDLTLKDGRPNLNGTWVSGGGGPPPRAAGGMAPAMGPAAGGGGDRNSAPLNEAGRTLQASWDPALDPAFVDCAPRSVHRVLLDRHTLKLTQADDQVIIELEGDGSKRVIRIDAAADQAAGSSVMGTAVARYEGDSLIIETSNMLGGASSQAGNILSDQMTMVEQYRRADTDGGAGLELTVTLNDPVYLATPWQLTQSRSLSSDFEFAETECQLPLFD